MLFSGTTIAQLIPFLISPILTRQFEPWQFGQVAFFNAILFPLIVLSTLRTELTLPLPEKDEEANQHAITAVIVSILFAFVIEGLIFLFWSDLQAIFNVSSKTSSSLYWVGPAIIAGSVMQLMTFWLIRKKAFRRVSYNKIGQTSSSGSTSVMLGVFRPGVGMVPGEVIGRYMGAIIGVIQSSREGFSWRGYIGFGKGLTALFKRFKGFVLYNSVPAFLNTASLNLPVLVASASFSEQTLGYFNFSRLVVGAPISLIAISVSQAFLPKLAERCREKKSIWPILRRNFLYMLFAGLPVAIAAYFLAPPVFEYVFGKGWGEAGRYTALLAFPYLAKFVVSPMSSALTALEKMNVVSIWQVLYFLVLFLLFLIEFNSSGQFVKTLAVFEIAVYGVYLVLIYLNVLKYERSIA